LPLPFVSVTWTSPVCGWTARYRACLSPAVERPRGCARPPDDPLDRKRNDFATADYPGAAYP
jgi:hypothetical protein